jgi:UPF0755 protein
MSRRDNRDELDLFGQGSGDREYYDGDDAADGEYDEYYDDYGYDDEVDGEPEPPRGKKKRSRVKWIVGIVVVLLILGGAGFGVAQVYGFGYYADWSGDGTGDVIVEVSNGDTLRDIGNTLLSDGVVASANAFVKASKTNAAIGNVQPGFYELRAHSSGASAVALMASPKAKVGVLQVKPGTMDDDTTTPKGAPAPGIISAIAKATCATVNGKSTCVSADQLRQAIETTPPAQLGVPGWAVPAVTAADPKHRLEGLVTPGIYSLKPGETALQTLKRILAQSDAQLQTAGLPSATQQNSGFSAYQVLVLASIIQRESGTSADKPKIARVLYNRLAATDPTVNKLSLDSTVDYALDKPQVLTSPAERAGAGPYDSYDTAGLPPTPISSPDTGSIQAAMQPSAGTWLYFVLCEKDGSSCFADTYAEQQANVAKAQQNGAY